jgi:hypothetical protein
MLNTVLKIVAWMCFFGLAVQAHAQDGTTPVPNSKELHLPGLPVAQFDADDTYDPFADYSEFDEAQEEESDINFFRHGRFVSIGLLGGERAFTSELATIEAPAFSYGLFLAYFFDLRFALQFSFNTSDHGFSVTSVHNQVATGTVNLTDFSVDLKYYLNTQNVTKGLASFNPYLIAGFSRVQRTTTVNGVYGYGQEGAMAFEGGLGIEFPIMHNRLFIGAQGLYQLINFPDRNTEIVFTNNDHTGVSPNGDSYTLLGIIGVNF